MKNDSRRRMRREQIERWLASEDTTVSEWCERNRISESTFYKWLAVFREEEPEVFGASKHDGWIEIARQSRKDAVALAVVGKGTGASAPPPTYHESWANRCCGANAPITVAVNGATVSIPSGSAALDIANVMKAVMGHEPIHRS